jgi:uncharacterized protein (DUF305 family)
MPNRSRLITLLAVAVALILGACSADQATEPQAPDAVRTERPASGQPGPTPEPATAHSEIQYMTHAMNHHAGGIGLAELCVHKATHHDLQALCRRAVEVQTHQVHALHRWLHDWYGVNHTPHVVPDDQRNRHRASGSPPGGTFRDRPHEALSAHHTQIIAASQHLLERAHHAHLRELAANIITHESQEITMMRSWLCHWYEECAHA